MRRDTQWQSDSPVQDRTSTHHALRAKNGSHGSIGESSKDDSVKASEAASEADPAKPYHRMRHDRSILALAVSDSCIYGGTQGGEILVSDTVLSISRFLGK